MILSVDLGQASDYTAISVIKAHVSGLLEVVHLERYPLGMSYPDQVEKIIQLFEKLKSSDPQPSHPGGTSIQDKQNKLVVDKTGVGRAVVDLLHDLRPIAITITGGNEVTKEGLNWNVPKRDLIHNLVVLFQAGKIKIARSLPVADVLIKELLNFKLKVNISTGHDSYEAWREGIHDDLVLSVAMGAFIVPKKSSGFPVSGYTRASYPANTSHLLRI